jgi:hypothetical protein
MVLTGVLFTSSGSSTNEPPNVVVNVAVTDLKAVIATAQNGLVPEQEPLQPENVAPAPADAVSVTVVPGWYPATHVDPQLMPDGLLAMLPGPVVVTVSVKNCWVKVAVTAVLALSTTTQVPVPEQPPPLQPAKLDPTSACAVKVTRVPGA